MGTVKTKATSKATSKPTPKPKATDDDTPDDDVEPSDAVAVGYQEHPIGVGVECPVCKAETISTWPFPHCWKCGNREWPTKGKGE